ncbi:aprataxin and PNK-like factor isoform X1 [Scleropages formosus]|uniref:Aprataxin and PNKP like factor n=1 Tax=Scleropages formosus TaxID=113540 RepID=A0A8C9QRR4_SCLFO|nr:aprataxin and PNK-like factor isoform X1 [Scleropages formosus]XP_018606351.2 aprataxin and PNK-like factor isoform X1 [Scleropages formosus]XP_018606352.2 aprataxin and PNK-like factor isoform X1 [Scleropages formosus]XP_018606354.2 aprataxin and PNK-like factor isoform X1 [Scleropages formosus]XP_018606355.2 aprataxin and PNK-like factor isoform X1 [Scleropages formosus]
MSQFELEPVDGDTSIPLPEGETKLGRGPFLGINDKRVSRHHCLLENRLGQLRIKPTHVNPCFCQPSLEDSPQPLEKDRWHSLHPGDLFSLLPGKHIFRVVSTGLDNTQRNSQAYEEGEAFTKSPDCNGKSNSVIPNIREQDKQTVVRNQNEEENSLKQAGSVDSSSKTEGRPRFEERKRVLPAWMMQTATDVQSPTAQKEIGKRGREKASPSHSQKQKSKQTRRRAISSGEESELSEEEERNRKKAKRKKIDKGEEPQPKPAPSAVLKRRRQVKAIQDKESEESHSAMVNCSTEKGEEGSTGKNTVKPSTSRCRREKSTERTEQEDQLQSTSDGARRKENSISSGESASSSHSTLAKPRLRTPCPYAKRCYRKNPVHFQECSHPGDSDYEEEEEDAVEDDKEDDDRPECPYGTSCYRKNPQHKKEYKHTKDPGKKLSSRGNDVEQDDEDSFIDDESEDLDEDSDYVPSESDDSVKLKRQKAAFLRK